MTDTINALLEDLCAALNVQDAQAVVRSGMIDIDGVTVYVEGRSGVYADEVVVYADLGAVPPAKAADIHRNLLEANLFWAGTGSATIGLHPETGHAVLAYQTPMADLNGAALAAAATQFAKIAAYWRRFIANGGEVSDTQPPESGGGAPGMMRV